MFAARNGLLTPPSLILPPAGPSFVSMANAVQHEVNSGDHTVSLSIDVTSAGGVILVPYWITSSNWVAISYLTRTVSTNQPGNTVNQGSTASMDAWIGSGSESHGGFQVAWILNPTIGLHTITVTTSYWQFYEILGAGALFYSGCSGVTPSGIAGAPPVNNRSLNVASAAGRKTLGVFTHNNTTFTGNGTARWTGVSLNTGAGWVDKLLVQEIDGAASVTHSTTSTDGGWGLGLDLAA